MDEKKVLKTIDEMLADPWQVDIQELFEASVNDPDLSWVRSSKSRNNVRSN